MSLSAFAFVFLYLKKIRFLQLCFNQLANSWGMHSVKNNEEKKNKMIILENYKIFKEYNFNPTGALVRTDQPV